MNLVCCWWLLREAGHAGSGHGFVPPIRVQSRVDICYPGRANARTLVVLQITLSHFLPASARSKNNDEHREVLMGLLITCSDLSASTKPWDIQKMITDKIFGMRAL